MASWQQQLSSAATSAGRALATPVPGTRGAVPWWAALGGGLVGIILIRSSLEANTGDGDDDGDGGDGGGSSMPPLDDYAAKDTTQAGDCSPTEKPGVLAFRRWAIDSWGPVKSPNVKNILRECSVGGASEHWEGRAWDLMTRDLDHGQAVVDGLTAPDEATGEPNGLARRAGIMYMIWNKRIWRSYDQGGTPRGTWAPYTGSNPHTDHVHISFGWPGAEGETSLYESIAPLNPANA